MAERNSTFKKATVPVNVRSRHDESNEVVTTGSWGWLQPIYTIDCIPGDVVNYKPNIYIRTPALATATFGSIKVSQHSFFVPARLLWSDWQNFLLGGDNGRQVYTKPYVYFGDLAALLCVDTPWREGYTSLTDEFFDELLRLKTTADIPHLEITHQERGLYSTLCLGLGLNPFAGSEGVDIQNSTVVEAVYNQKIDMMPFRAYQKIWWDYYRDSVLIPESAKNSYIKMSGGLQYQIDFEALDQLQDFAGIEQLQARKKAYKKDYFTTAKTSPQQGVAQLVPVELASSSVNPGIVSLGNGGSGTIDVTGVDDVNTVSIGMRPDGRQNNVVGQYNIEVLRVANSYQRFFEKNNAVGSRPIAQILARYGMSPSAERLDMAEYVDGEDRMLNIQQVTSTAQTSDGDLAEVSAYGWVRHSGGNQRYVVREHGFFMSLLAIEPMTGYCDGIDPMFQCFEKEQHYTPEFENNGYDAIANKELYCSVLNYDEGQPAQQPDQAFGFQPRYSRYKYKKDVLAGDMARLNTAKGSDAFHTFRRFSRTPALNEKFVEVHTSQYGNNFNRLFTNTNDDYDPFYINIYNENIMERPMTGFATPALSNVNEQDGRHISVPYGGVRM